MQTVEDWPDDDIEDFQAVVDLGSHTMAAQLVEELGGNIWFARNGEILEHDLSHWEFKNLISTRKLRNIITILTDFDCFELFKMFKRDPELRFFTNYVVYYISSRLTLYFLNGGDVKMLLRENTPDQEPMSIVIPLSSFKRLFELSDMFSLY